MAAQRRKINKDASPIHLRIPSGEPRQTGGASAGRTRVSQ